MAVQELRLDLLPRFKQAELKVRQAILSKMLQGEWTTMFKGRSMEFTGFRKYEYGDDASLIDWGASLRAKDILVREFEEYRNFEIFFMLDVSDSMLFSSTGRLKCEYAAEVLYAIMYGAINSDNAIGMGMFNDGLIKRIEATVGRANYFKIIKAITDPKNYGGGFDLKKGIQYLQTFLKRRSLIIFLSDFIGAPSDLKRMIAQLCENNDVIGIMIRDPRDYKLPKEGGQFLIQDPYSDEKIQIDANEYSLLYEHEAKKQLEEIRSAFKVSKGGFLTLSTDEDFYDPLLKLFRQRMHMIE